MLLFMSGKYREIIIPPAADFPVQKILVPTNAKVVGLRYSNSRGNKSSEEELHVLSNESQNIAKLTHNARNGSLRKKIWRGVEENRCIENERRRKRDKHHRATESVQHREERLRRRREWYKKKYIDSRTRPRALGRTQSESLTASGQSFPGLSEASSDPCCSQASSFSEQQSSNSTSMESTSVNNSVSLMSTHSSTTSNSIEDSNGNCTEKCLYEMHVESQVVRTHAHFLKALDTLPLSNVVILHIHPDSNEAFIHSNLPESNVLSQTVSVAANENSIAASHENLSTDS